MHIDPTRSTKYSEYNLSTVQGALSWHTGTTKARSFTGAVSKSGMTAPSRVPQRHRPARSRTTPSETTSAVSAANTRFYANLFFMKTHPISQTLSNGMTLIMIPQPGQGFFHIDIAIRTGSITEHDSDVGCAHVSEHVVAHEIRSLLSHNTWAPHYAYDTFEATTHLYSTHFELSLQSKDTAMVEKLLDRIYTPHVSQKVLTQEQNYILEEIAQHEDDREQVYNSIVRSKIRAQSRYAPIGTGTKKQVRRFTPSDVRHFLKQWYNPTHSVITVAGTFNPNAIKKLCEAFISNTPPHLYVAPFDPPARSLHFLPRHDGLVDISINIPLACSNAQEFIRLDVATYCFTHYLSLTLQEQFSLYNCYSNISGYVDHAMWHVDIQCDPKKADAVCKALFNASDSFQQAIRTTHLNALRNAYATSLHIEHQKREDITSVASWHAIVFNTALQPQDLIRASKRVPLETIRQIIASLMPHPHAIACIGGTISGNAQKRITQAWNSK